MSPEAPRLILILGDQLSLDMAALRASCKERDVVMMAEVMSEATYVRHHPKKIAFTLASMRKFAAQLGKHGWRVVYSRLNDPENSQSIPGEVLRWAAELGVSEVLVTEPGEWRLIDALGEVPLSVCILEDDRFLASHAEFEGWAAGRKQLRMEYFYREMRRKTGLMMEGNKPAGGQWNYDHDNRKPANSGVGAAGPLTFEPDAEVLEVLALVEDRFGGNFGDLHPFWFATDKEQAQAALSHFVKDALPHFGDYQDAMLTGETFLYHSVLSLYLNAGLLCWQEICGAVEAAWASGDVPTNAAEGYIRQVIGWREYVRGIYFLEGPGYPRRNALNHKRSLPEFYWTGDTRMACMREAIGQTRSQAYSHHIQRLMVTGNFAVLAGIDPYEVHEWYLAVYADAYEWVEAPNTVGMSQWADGGIVASKPYVSSGSYIDRMSNYCKTCDYSVKTRTGEGACPFNLLYWDFLVRNRDRFEGNPRMANMYRTWDRMDAVRRETVLADAVDLLAKLDRKERI